MYISIDLGGTNTRIANSENLNTFLEVDKIPTPKNLNELSTKLNSFINSIPNLQYVCIGIAGFVDKHNKIIIKCPHIPYLRDLHIEDVLDVPMDSVLLENDAALAGLGEATHGQGKSFNRVAYITISTGVGGTLIVDKEIPTKQYNFEPGHHVINVDENFEFGEVKGTFESYCSGTAFKKRFGLDPAEVEDKKIWHDYGEILAIGLYNLVLFWQPDVIILGGSMSKKANLFFKSLDEKFMQLAQDQAIPIKISDLGDNNGLLGGLELIRSLNPS